MERSSGIILPIYSLPSPYGIGTLGQAARDFVDFLVDAGQAWWQVLPVGPTSYGDSPYQSPSTFAGNPYFVDLDSLVDDGLLEQAEIDAVNWGDDPVFVDYRRLFETRADLLRRAYERGWERDSADVWAFCNENASWLGDYALFMAVKRHFGMAIWTEWPDEDIRLHKPDAIERYRELLIDEVQFNEYVQFLFFKQWEQLHGYAREKGVRLMGDLPIYVALDSADVWANPSQFVLDERNMPIEVAGVPPDAFTADGQLWGNPLYDYGAMEADGFGWWIRRVGGAVKLFDMVRIDHFRGFESYWAVPVDEKTACNGRWVKGPGMRLVGTLQSWFYQFSFVAEDLGYTTPEVAALLADSGLPGMKVLELAFDSRDESSNAHMPHSYGPNCVCYVGTHDNATIMQWRDEADPDDVHLAERYLGLNDQEGFAWGFIRGGMASVADLFVAQMQDYLELGADARTNTPGTLGSNWRWRMADGQATPELAARIAAVTRLYGRGAR
ncbi:MAG: 4-alpha-glucanotransferase [Eggerthellaceae bacterium]|nr:4-alpha-glucanotransferase [Eggerthellaceae bacterium]